MKDKEDKKKQKKLEQQQAEDRALFLKAYEQANKPDPLEERRRADALAFLDTVEGKDRPFDVRDTPGLSPYLNLYERAKEGEAADANTDTGLFQLGATGGSPSLIARMREQNRMRREERAAGDLASAFAGRYAEVTGNTVPFLMRYKQGRDLDLAGLTAGKSGSSTGMWASFKPADSIWSKLWQQAVSGASQGAAMAAGGA
jgi:hypothetical protein